MNKAKVALELVKIAKELVAAKGPDITIDMDAKGDIGWVTATAKAEAGKRKDAEKILKKVVGYMKDAAKLLKVKKSNYTIKWDGLYASVHMEYKEPDEGENDTIKKLDWLAEKIYHFES